MFGTWLYAYSFASGWTKHDGFRLIARKIGKRVRLYSRPGNDLTWRFPLIVEALATLGSVSCSAALLCPSDSGTDGKHTARDHRSDLHLVGRWIRPWSGWGDTSTAYLARAYALDGAAGTEHTLYMTS
jgi:hypothetical protein